MYGVLHVHCWASVSGGSRCMWRVRLTGSIGWCISDCDCTPVDIGEITPEIIETRCVEIDVRVHAVCIWLAASITRLKSEWLPIGDGLALLQSRAAKLHVADLCNEFATLAIEDAHEAMPRVDLSDVTRCGRRHRHMGRPTFVGQDEVLG
ncbi:MAG: hypothetical protein EPO46_04315 [Lysobacter sp.]|nr:MAG: hypothetical protein EPO46_04315 [Lysobacter sp.]